jgi:hypothetical protein
MCDYGWSNNGRKSGEPNPRRLDSYAVRELLEAHRGQFSAGSRMALLAPFEHPREAKAELILDLRRFHLGTSMNEQLLDSTGGLLTTVFVTLFTRARQYAGNYVGARVKGSSSVAERGPA